MSEPGDDQTYWLRAVQLLQDEKESAVRGLGYTHDHDLLHEPEFWQVLLSKQLGDLAFAILRAPSKTEQRERWFRQMQQPAVQMAQVALSFVAQLEMRFDGLKEQGKEVGQG